MPSFEMKIDSGNDALACGNFHAELRRIMLLTMNTIDSGDFLPEKWSNIRDVNGNIIGVFKITE